MKCKKCSIPVEDQSIVHMMIVFLVCSVQKVTISPYLNKQGVKIKILDVRTFLGYCSFKIGYFQTLKVLVCKTLKLKKTLKPSILQLKNLWIFIEKPDLSNFSVLQQ